MIERWKPVTGREEYEVSYQGRMRSVDRVVSSVYRWRQYLKRLHLLGSSGPIPTRGNGLLRVSLSVTGQMTFGPVVQPVVGASVQLGRREEQ